MEGAPNADSIEAEFARRLAGNEKKTRDRALKKLRQYLNLRSAKSSGGFTRVEMLSLWKGLFYCMWMSDKPLVQEELANTISDLILGVANTKTAMLFFDVFLETMRREWRGIDRLRMDKFYLLVRCVLSKGFRFLQTQKWDSGVIDWMLAILKNGPISPNQPLTGMQYHMCDIYLEELAKVCGNTLPPETVMKFIDPYCILITKSKNSDLVRAVLDEVFQQLVENSKPALDLLAEEEDLVNVGSHTQIERCDSSPVCALNVDYRELADRLFELASHKDVLARNRKKVFNLVEKFRELAEGRLPLADVPDAEYSSGDEVEMLEQQLANEIVSEITKDVQENDAYKKKRKHRKRRMKFEVEEDAVEEYSVLETNSIDADGASCESEKGDVDEPNNNSISDNIQKKKRRNKKKFKAGTNSVIIGSSLPEIQLENNSNESVENGDTTLVELASQSSNEANNCVKKQNLKNMPDILQHISEEEQCDLTKTKNEGKESFTLLKQWLNTGTSPGKDERSAENGTREATKGAAEVTVPSKKEKKKRKNTSASAVSHNAEIPKKAGSAKQAGKDDGSTTEETIEILVRNKSKTKKKPTPKKLNSEGEKFAQINSVGSVHAKSTFFKLAAAKVDKAVKNKHLAAVKRKQEPIAAHSPKRVVFEMSKTQVQPFRRNDKSISISPSPNNVAFDPRKTPDFGLLKSGQKQQKRKAASDFF